jgi:hypothetical protein
LGSITPKLPCNRQPTKQGVQLEANFGVGEPLERVHETVSCCLRSPATLFELILPDRKPLPRAGRVGDAGIAPSVLLNFRAVEGHGASSGSCHALSDAMLQLAQVD